MIPGRRSHDVRPMSPSVVSSERRPSASEELSRPSLQNLPLPGSESGGGRGDSCPAHFVGDAVSRRLGFLGVGDPKSSSTTSFLPPRSHSRVDSNSVRDAPSNMSSATLVSVSKQHASPSKVRVDRLYSQFRSLWCVASHHRLDNFQRFSLSNLFRLLVPDPCDPINPTDTPALGL